MSHLPESIFDLESYYDQKEKNECKIFELIVKLMGSYERFSNFLSLYVSKCLPKYLIKRFQFKDDKWHLDYIIKTQPDYIVRSKKPEKELVQFLNCLCDCIDEYLENAYREILGFLETGKMSHKCFREYLNIALIEGYWQNIHDNANEFRSKKKKISLENEILESL